MIRFVDLKRQYMEYKNDIDRAIKDVLESGQFILGRQVDELEDRLADFVGTKHCITCSSGTDALLLALMALEIKEGDEVITTPFTFIATAETVAFLGATPVFVDVSPRTFNIDPEKIEEKITSRTRCIVAVDLYGQCADFDRINEIARRYNIFVIEDGAQSFGATYKGRFSCSLSDIGITSFFPAKPLGCYGDGGAVFVKNDELAKKIRALRNHGQLKRYEHSYIGINGRLDTIQAAILLAKLPYFPREIKKRQQVATYYSERLQSVVTVPFIEPHNTSVFAQYTIQVERRDDLRKFLASKDIPTAVHYPVPLHLQKCFGYLGYRKGDLPISEEMSEKVLSLPMHPFITREEQDLVINSILDFYV